MNAFQTFDKDYMWLMIRGFSVADIFNRMIKRTTKSILKLQRHKISKKYAVVFCENVIFWISMQYAMNETP